MMDLKRYYRLMSQKYCWAERSGDDVKILTKRFDNETGIELSPEYQHTTVQQLKLDKVELEQQLEALNSILIDIKA
jgi:hypothetical protein